MNTNAYIKILNKLFYTFVHSCSMISTVQLKSIIVLSTLVSINSWCKLAYQLLYCTLEAGIGHLFNVHTNTIYCLSFPFFTRILTFCRKYYLLYITPMLPLIAIIFHHTASSIQILILATICGIVVGGLKAFAYHHLSTYLNSLFLDSVFEAFVVILTVFEITFSPNVIAPFLSVYRYLIVPFAIGYFMSKNLTFAYLSSSSATSV